MNNDLNKPLIKTRIAPSPTGLFHIGTARTALFNYLFAKQNNGQFLFRLEDTDKERSKPEYEEDIKAGLLWLGLQWDGEIIRQSDTLQHHLDAADQLKKEGLAYEKDGAIWFKVPEEEVVTFTDLIRGEVTFKTEDIEDFVIVRSDGQPTYYLGIIDDFDMGITHAIRGEDLLSTTPKQVLLSRALRFPELNYAHLPLILNPDRSKLSKRHGATSVKEYKEKGYLPEAMINFFALLGWHPSDDREFFSLDELIKEFDLTRASKSGAIFDGNKLNSINHHYIDKLLEADQKEIDAVFKPYWPKDFSAPYNSNTVIVFESYLDTLNQFTELVLQYLGPIKDYDKTILIFKKSTQDKIIKGLQSARKSLEELEDFEQNKIHTSLLAVVSEKQLGMGDVFYPVRVALSGQQSSPPPEDLAWLLGKEETLKRLDLAIKKLS